MLAAATRRRAGRRRGRRVGRRHLPGVDRRRRGGGGAATVWDTGADAPRVRRGGAQGLGTRRERSRPAFAVAGTARAGLSRSASRPTGPRSRPAGGHPRRVSRRLRDDCLPPSSVDWRLRTRSPSGGLAVTKYVYDFSEGNKDMKDLLGGKGANLAEMTNMGLPVPPGFTITTEACLTFLGEGGAPPEMLRGGRRAPRPSRGRDGQDARRPRRSAARLGAFGREVLDARDDGHGPEPRSERRLGRGAREADRGRRAVRARRLPPVHPDVRQDRDGRAGRRVRARARRGEGGEGRRTRRTPTSTPTTCAR